MSVRPAKTQISLGIRPVWSESSLCAQWASKGPRFLHADSEDSDQIRPVWSESSLGAHSFCWFCHEAAQIVYSAMPGQAVKLVDRMKSDSNIDMKKDWKVITLFVGGNDLCDYCDDKVSTF